MLVAIDDQTIAGRPRRGLPDQPQARRRRDRQALEGGRGVIAYQTQFTDASDDPDADDALVQAVHDAHNVVLGTSDVGEDGTTGIFGGEDGLKYSGATPANTNLQLDRGRPRSPHAVRSWRSWRPSLSRPPA